MPIEVLVDGAAQKIEQPKVDKQGHFSVTIKPILTVGGHTILVRQKTERGMVQEAYTFNVTVEDFPREGREKD